MVVSVVAGLGEFLGYGARYFSGRAADRRGRYWPIMLTGYVINLLSVPLLALAGAWPVAMMLLIAERVGRAIRSPIRSAMLSHAASRTGAGWGFGLHTALDQTGGARQLTEMTARPLGLHPRHWSRSPWGLLRPSPI